MPVRRGVKGQKSAEVKTDVKRAAKGKKSAKSSEEGVSTDSTDQVSTDPGKKVQVN